MITNREELKDYLERDKIALGKKGKQPKYLGDEIWKFEILLRKYEYYYNTKKSIIDKFFCTYYHLKFKKMSVKLGFSIPVNVFGKGLSIAHYGTIVVNGNAKVGENCRIQENVTIGSTNGEKKAPVIGNNVFLGSGAKVIGDIYIADDVCVGAGAVVVKSVDKCAVTVAGVPAKIISNQDSHSNLCKDLFV